MRKIWMALLLCVLAFTACGGPAFKGTVRENATPAPDFTLHDQNNQPFRLSAQQGRVVFLFFGYTFCPDECPTTLITFQRVDQLLGTDAGNVRFVLITVDPERDTPERLKKYLNVFNPSFIGLTGTPAELESVYAAYGVYHEKAPAEHGAAGYSVMHTLAVYVIDRDGRWRLLEDYSAPPEDMAHDARILLKE